jgi:hypothetical protein
MRRKRSKSSRFLGVGVTANKQKWHASVRVNGRTKHLGTFEDEVEAAHARDAAIRKNKKLKGWPGNNVMCVYNFPRDDDVTDHPVTSRFRGVSVVVPGWKWRAKIQANGASKHLGTFDGEEAAARAYDAAARQYFRKKKPKGWTGYNCPGDDDVTDYSGARDALGAVSGAEESGDEVEEEDEEEADDGEEVWEYDRVEVGGTADEMEAYDADDGADDDEDKDEEEKNEDEDEDMEEEEEDEEEEKEEEEAAEEADEEEEAARFPASRVHDVAKFIDRVRRHTVSAAAARVHPSALRPLSAVDCARVLAAATQALLVSAVAHAGARRSDGEERCEGLGRSGAFELHLARAIALDCRVRARAGTPMQLPMPGPLATEGLTQLRAALGAAPDDRRSTSERGWCSLCLGSCSLGEASSRAGQSKRACSRCDAQFHAGCVARWRGLRSAAIAAQSSAAPERKRNGQLQLSERIIDFDASRDVTDTSCICPLCVASVALLDSAVVGCSGGTSVGLRRRVEYGQRLAMRPWLASPLHALVGADGHRTSVLHVCAARGDLDRLSQALNRFMPRSVLQLVDADRHAWFIPPCALSTIDAGGCTPFARAELAGEVECALLLANRGCGERRADVHAIAEARRAAHARATARSSAAVQRPGLSGDLMHGRRETRVIQLRNTVDTERLFPAAGAAGAAGQVSVLLCTVTFYANLAHSLTRSP